jgi:hypothetical protein
VVNAAVHPIVDHLVAFASGCRRETDHSRRIAEEAEELAIDSGHRREVLPTSYDREHALSPLVVAARSAPSTAWIMCPPFWWSK